MIDLSKYTRAFVLDEESGTFTALIIEFPGCATEGSSLIEAYDNLEKVAESWIEAALEMGQEIPAPGSIGIQVDRYGPPDLNDLKG